MDAIKILNPLDTAEVVKTAAVSPMVVGVDRNTTLVVENGSAAAITVTIKAIKGNADKAFTVAANKEQLIHMPQDWLYTSGDNVTVEFSAVATVNVFAIQTK